MSINVTIMHEGETRWVVADRIRFLGGLADFAMSASGQRQSLSLWPTLGGALPPKLVHSVEVSFLDGAVRNLPDRFPPLLRVGGHRQIGA
ncbi:hypothetical protein [Arvimicrobium flavum]|uniref:hypothetical protein n=1 Tax=Arvimicrobium flavum TaxID=3393320 RepID=UPI00237A8DFB|nr:hypothetical protein [Mesorhizobium shangrilense]